MTNLKDLNISLYLHPDIKSTLVYLNTNEGIITLI